MTARSALAAQPAVKRPNFAKGAQERAAGEGQGVRVDRPRETPQRTANGLGPHQALLALDLGTATGWALRAPDGSIVSGTQHFRPGRFEGGGMRYLRMRGWLAELQAGAGPIGAVYFEEVRRHAGVDAAHVYGGMLATLTAWCEAAKVPYCGVPVGVIKRHATGKGNADKAAVMRAMQSVGFDPADGNEADALALLAWAAEQPEIAGGNA